MEFLTHVDLSDLHPLVELNELDQAACIAYGSEYKSLLRLFIALQMREERSERALLVTEQLLNINPAHYTVWEFRRECVFALNRSPVHELDFVDEFADNNPKNYQIWYHRRAIAMQVGPDSVEREKEFTEGVFAEDAKNYHAWAHRQYIVREFAAWEGELELTERFIADDMRNNSAWNHVSQA